MIPKTENPNGENANEPRSDVELRLLQVDGVIVAEGEERGKKVGVFVAGPGAERGKKVFSKL